MGFKIILGIFFLWCITLVPAAAQSAAHVVDTTHKTAHPPSATTQDQDIRSDDDFAPGLLFVLVLGLGLIFLCTALGLMAAGIIALSGMALVSLGIFSASALVAWRTKSVSWGFRVMILLSSCLGGMLMGAVAIFLWNRWHPFSTDTTLVLASGAGAGILAGLVLAQCIHLLLQRIFRFYAAGH